MRQYLSKIFTSLFVCGMVGIVGTSAVNAMPEGAPDSDAPIIKVIDVNLRNRSGSGVGHVKMEETLHGTLVHIEIDNLPPGVHAFHIHETGKCEPPFKSAGGHFNPENKEHGYKSVNGPHLGDFPNIHVPGSGKIELEYFHPWLMINDELLDEDLSAIVIHQGADDYKTNPAGDAGPRLACGVIKYDQ